MTAHITSHGEHPCAHPDVARYTAPIAHSRSRLKSRKSKNGPNRNYSSEIGWYCLAGTLIRSGRFNFGRAK